MRSAAGQLFSSRKVLLAAGAVAAVCFLIFVSVFCFYYFKYQRIVDERLEKPLFANTAKIYAAPAELRPGQKLTRITLPSSYEMRGIRATATRRTAPMGTYSAGAGEHHGASGTAVVSRPGGRRRSPSTAARSARLPAIKGRQLAAYELEPLLITDLSDAEPLEATAGDLRRAAAQPGASRRGD